MKEKVKSLLEDFEILDEKIASIPPNDTDQMMNLSRERKKMEPIIDSARKWLSLSDELDSIEEMIQGHDREMASLASREKPALAQKFEILDKTLYKLLNPPDPRADKNSIIEIRAGAGGDEAGIFAADLYRMYSKFAQSKGLAVEVFTSNSTGVGGLKEIIFGISGPNAYGWFRFEQGVHRVQRVPLTEAQGRIHTSTVTVAVLPEATEVDIKIDPKDLRIDTYRASGAGGQHVNKTDSAIRITHIPTGVVAQCQEERSQGQNRLKAMALLRTQMQEMEEAKANKERRDMRRKQIGSGDRSEKIRTYNFPQDRITDHRINHSVYGMEKFLAGNLDDMISEILLKEEELRKDDSVSS